MAKSKRLRIEDIDPNFGGKSAKASLKWIDAFDRRLALRGFAWVAENRKKKNFRRLPDRKAKQFSEGVQLLSHHPAGGFLSFFTDSADVSVRMTVSDAAPMNHMPATGMAGAELFFRDGPTWIPAGTVIPHQTDTTFTSLLLENGPKIRREYRLYLPLYKKLESLAIGLSPKALVRPAPSAAKPIFFYGTSITQGGCANTPGSDFVSTVGRLLDTEVINFGFSGNGKGEPEIARLIREIDAEMFILDFQANADGDTLAAVLPEFIRLLREKHPSTPCVLMTNPGYDSRLTSAAARDLIDHKRDISMQVYLEKKAAGDPNIHFIDGYGLLPGGLSGAYVDGVHPTSHGFALMAERLAPQLRTIRLQEQFGSHC
jgi:hypothetical protein